MKHISQREKVLVIAAASVVAVFILVFLVIRPMRTSMAVSSTTAQEKSLRALHAEVREKDRLAGQLESTTERLSVKIPSVSIQEQIQGMISTMESAAGKNRIKFATFSPEAVSPGRAERNRRPGADISFDLKFTCSSGSLVGFIQGLESEGLPFIVDSLDINGDMQKPDSLDVSMRITVYMLQPMNEAEKKEEEPDAPPA